MLSKRVGIPLAIGLTLVFILIRFPWDSLARRVAYEISAASGSDVTMQSLAPGISERGPVLRAIQVQILHPAVDRVRLSTLEIAPRLSMGWLTGEPRLRVWADSELGVIDGVLELGAAPKFVGRVERVDLERLPLRLDASAVRLSGQLNADADIALRENGTLLGRVDFESTDLVLAADALPMALPFTRANGVIEILESGATKIESVTLDGPLIAGSLSGEIGLAHRSQSPPIDLALNLRIIDETLRQLAPGAGFALSDDGRIDTRVRGTLDTPQIARLRAPRNAAPKNGFPTRRRTLPLRRNK